MSLNKSTAVCPGSYDPVTNGHLDVIQRAAGLYEQVVVAVVRRSVRKNATLFDIEERVGFIERATAELPGVRVEPFSNLVVEFARSVGAKAIVKGLRAISDFEYELELHQLNRRQDPEIESVYLMSSRSTVSCHRAASRSLPRSGAGSTIWCPPRWQSGCRKSCGADEQDVRRDVEP